MARILNVTLGIRSHLNAQIAFIERARELGHECVLCSPSAAIEEDARSAGIRFVQLDPPKGRWSPAPYRRGAIAGSAQRRHARERADAVMSGLGLLELLHDGAFDLVVIHAELHEFILVAMLSGARTAVIDTHLSTTRRSNVPILSSRFIPSDGLVSRLWCWWLWTHALTRRRLGRLIRRLAGTGLDKHSVMKRLAKEHGRELETLVDLGHWPIYSFRQLPNLRLTVPEMDFFPPMEEPRHIFLGPMTRKVESRNEDPGLLSDIDRFIASRPSGEPLVLMTLGTIKTLPRRIRTAIEAVRSRPVHLLVATGKAHEALAGESLPENVYTAQWLPVAHLLQSASIAICHGGAATIHECIGAGKPMLVYSTGFLDQDGNAARIEGLGLGVRGLKRDSSSEMWRRIVQLLDDPEARRRCEEMRQRFEDYGSLSRLDDVLSRCLSDPQSVGG